MNAERIERGPHSDAWAAGMNDMTAATDKADGEYLDVWGPLMCHHCGQSFGGSGAAPRGVALGGYALHLPCFPLAVNIALAAKRLTEAAKS